MESPAGEKSPPAGEGVTQKNNRRSQVAAPVLFCMEESGARDPINSPSR